MKHSMYLAIAVIACGGGGDTSSLEADDAESTDRTGSTK